MKFPTLALNTLAILSGSQLANAVCTGYNLAVGTADVLTTGYTSCNNPSLDPLEHPYIQRST